MREIVMERRTRKIRIDGENFMVVKPLKYGDEGTSSNLGDGFEKIRNHYTLKGLASFLGDERNGNKINFLCEESVRQNLKKYHIEQDEKKWEYLNNKLRKNNIK